MQKLWCWRCKMELAMLDEEEYRRESRSLPSLRPPCLLRVLWTYVGNSLVVFVSSLCPLWEPAEFPTETTVNYTKTTGLM
jgi:hypothetical protein